MSSIYDRDELADKIERMPYVSTELARAVDALRNPTHADDALADDLNDYAMHVGRMLGAYTDAGVIREAARALREPFYPAPDDGTYTVRELPVLSDE